MQAARGRTPIQIRAQVLCTGGTAAPYYAKGGFAAMPDDTTADDGAPDSAAPCGSGWRDADLKRAIAVAETSNLQRYRIEIGLDGVISIIVGAAA